MRSGHKIGGNFSIKKQLQSDPPLCDTRGCGLNQAKIIEEVSEEEIRTKMLTFKDIINKF